MINPTDAAAWWGAIVATIAVVWDFVKWNRGGPRLRVHIAPNMVIVGGSPLLRDNNTYIRVDVRNNGDQKTTVNSLDVIFYSSWLDKIVGNGDYFFVANPALASAALPVGIGAGEQWSGNIIQTAELERKSRSGMLFVGVYHTGSLKPVLSRVRIQVRSEK